MDTLVWLGREREAEGYAELRASDEGKFYSSLAICQALHEKGELDNAHMSKILQVSVGFLIDASKKYEPLLIKLSLFLVQAKLITYFDFVYAMIKLFGSQELLLVLLVFLIESGESKRTDELLKIAEETISSKTSDIEKLKIYCNLTLALFNANYIDEANDFLSKIRRFIKEIYLDEVETRTEALLEFAKFLSFLNLERYTEEANQYFIEIKETIFNLDDYFTKSYLLQELANSLSELGRFDEARELVYSIPEDTSYRSDALSKLANALGKNGRSKEASILLNKATDIRYVTGKWHHDSIVELVNILKKLDYEAQSETLLARFVMNEPPAERGFVSMGEVTIAACGAPFILNNKFVQMFSLIGFYGIDNFLYTLINLADAFEEFESGLSLEILKEAIFIAGWLNQDWQEIYKIIDFQEAESL